MPIKQLLKQLEEMLLQMDLDTLPPARLQLAFLDARLVTQINNLQKTARENQN